MPRKVIIDLAEILQYCTNHKLEKIRGEKPGDTQEVFTGQLGKSLIPYDAPSGKRIKSAAKLLSKSSKKRKLSEKRRSEKRKSSKKKRKIDDKEGKIEKKSISSMEEPEEEISGAGEEYGNGRGVGEDSISEHDIAEKQETGAQNSSTDSDSESDKSSGVSSSEDSENESSSSDSQTESSENSDSE